MVRSDPTYANLLSRAAELLGGAEQLCRRLQVPAEQCASWLAGRTVPPNAVVVAVVDILLEHLGPPDEA
jgi:hypothetical protein